MGVLNEKMCKTKNRKHGKEYYYQTSFVQMMYGLIYFLIIAAVLLFPILTIS